MIAKNGLKIDAKLVDFLATEALPGTGISEDQFWSGFASIIHDLAPQNRALLKKRDELQAQIDDWNEAHGANLDMAAYKTFLKSIDYLREEGPDFEIVTQNVDDEIAKLAGPQLVVPVNNARFALNAANARWGSLYDALYGTDALGHAKGKSYDADHGAKVISWVRDFLDEAVPLRIGSWSTLKNFSTTLLKDASQALGWGKTNGNDTLLFVHNGLHIEIVFDRSTEIGSSDDLGISDVVIES
ncbi:MAG: malate synthase G, partial [Alphaproteobacteria bacterium]|nr:malate synthase G [Alphaproteobacteria bacterium]